MVYVEERIPIDSLPIDPIHLSTIFDSSGESKPPCGEPFVGIPSPSISAFSILDIQARTCLSLNAQIPKLFNQVMYD